MAKLSDTRKQQTNTEVETDSGVAGEFSGLGAFRENEIAGSNIDTTTATETQWTGSITLHLDNGVVLTREIEGVNAEGSRPQNLTYSGEQDLDTGAVWNVTTADQEFAGSETLATTTEEAVDQQPAIARGSMINGRFTSSWNGPGRAATREYLRPTITAA